MPPIVLWIPLFHPDLGSKTLRLFQYGPVCIPPTQKESLRPIYDALIAAVNKFGKNVEVSPKKSYVSLRRSMQFALIQPSTATRVDVGINLKGTPPAGRLEASGSFNAMVSHRVRVENKPGVDKELIGWLQQAYGAA